MNTNAPRYKLERKPGHGSLAILIKLGAKLQTLDGEQERADSALVIATGTGHLKVAGKSQGKRNSDVLDIDRSGIHLE